MYPGLMREMGFRVRAPTKCPSWLRGIAPRAGVHESWLQITQGFIEPEDGDKLVDVIKRLAGEAAVSGDAAQNHRLHILASIKHHVPLAGCFVDCRGASFSSSSSSICHSIVLMYVAQDAYAHPHQLLPQNAVHMSRGTVVGTASYCAQPGRIATHAASCHSALHAFLLINFAPKGFGVSYLHHHGLARAEQPAVCSQSAATS